MNSVLNASHPRRLHRFGIVLIGLFLFPFMPAVAQPAADFFSIENRNKFANYLFSSKDYLRALEEYKAILKQTENDTVRFKFAECFLRIGRYTEAADNYKSLFYNSSLMDEARLNFFRSRFLTGEYSSFRDAVENENYASDKYKPDINRLYFISYLFDNSTLPDTNRFFEAFADSIRKDVRKFYFAKKWPAYKSSTTAALLSAAVPGLGKIYTGKIGDGITSFIATGLLVYLAFNNFEHDHNFRGWVFSGLAFLSYAGNIYGSAASAQIYNAGVKFNFDREVKIYFEKRNFLLPEIGFVKE